MMNTYRAELMVISKRMSTWVLLAVMLTMTAVFAYVLPYATYVSDSESPKAIRSKFCTTRSNKTFRTRARTKPRFLWTARSTLSCSAKSLATTLTVGDMRDM